jgi:hypothetical protein
MLSHEVTGYESKNNIQLNTKHLNLSKFKSLITPNSTNSFL